MADVIRGGTTRTRVLTLGACLVVTLAAGLVATTGEVPGPEASVFHAINDLPDFLRWPMWVFQLAGLLLVPAAVALGASVLRRWWLAGSLVVFIPLKLAVEKLVVKQLVERQRPYLTVCDGDAACANFRDAPTSGLSFVSGHAIIAWGVAGLLWPYLPGRWRWLPVTVATLNAIARVYLGAHNPLDVVGGAAIGLALAVLLTMARGHRGDDPAAASPGSWSATRMPPTDG